MDTTHQNGFTLVELLIALAVAAILLGVGIPSFSGAIKNSQVSSDYNGIVQALYLARSEAVKTSELVTVCPKKEIDSTLCGEGLNDWKYGWMVFIDRPPESEDKAEIGPEDEIISIHKKLRSDNTVTAYGSDDRSKPSKTDRFFIQYEVDGKANWGNGTFKLCNAKEDELSRAINIAPTGDVRPGRPNGSELPTDVYGDDVC